MEVDGAFRHCREARWLLWTLGEALGPESCGQIPETLGTQELVHRTRAGGEGPVWFGLPSTGVHLEVDISP